MDNFTLESKSHLAKLLATENITIKHQKMNTAMFDLKTRTLYCPIWTDMNGYLYDLLMGHEVGHAQETPAEGWHSALEKRGKNFKHFLNVIEDARIEKKIKRRYPGIKKSFIEGYKNLLNRDFFGIKNHEVNDLFFIDRINLYTKCGAILGITFNDEEMKLLKEVESCETWKDVVAIAEKLFEYSKQEQQQKRNQDYMSDHNSFDYDEYDMDMDASDFDSEDDEFESSKGEESDSQNDGSEFESEKGEESDSQNDGSEFESSKGEESDSESDEETKKQQEYINRDKETKNYDHDYEPVCKTDEEYRKNEASLVDNKSQEYQYVNIPEPNMKRILVPYKQVHSLLDDHIKLIEKKEHAINMFNKFKNKNGRYVSLLAKEFEMRKAAKSFSKRKIANTGDINVDNIYKYQIDDSIFKKIMKVPKGKSHGLILLLDYSGSMRSNMNGSWEQIMVIAMFCRKVNIPFTVYTFGNALKTRDMDFQNKSKNYIENYSFNYKKDDMFLSDLSLREYLSSKMTAGEFNKAMQNISLVKEGFTHSRYCFPTEQLSNTPLIEAMIALQKITIDFRKQNNLDIVNTVVVHDGDADSVKQMVSNNETKGTGYINTMNNIVINDKKNKLAYDVKFVLKNNMPITNGEAYRQAIFKWYKETTKSDIIGFYILEESQYQARREFNKKYYNDESVTYNYFFTEEKEKLYNQFKKLQSDKFLTSNNPGYKSFYFVIGGKNLDTEEDQLVIQGNIPPSKLKTAFSKMNNKKNVNRILVNKFIGNIAV